MSNFLSSLIAPWFGYPGVALTLLLLLIGIWRQDWRPATVSLVTILPFTVYLMGTPSFRLLALVFPVLQGVAAWLIWREKRWWALLPQSPLVLLMLGLLCATWTWQG
ncbi:MAG: hypothetical protein Fur0043_25160 [Anaerolineales bacterium]